MSTDVTHAQQWLFCVSPNHLSISRNNFLAKFACLESRGQILWVPVKERPSILSLGEWTSSKPERRQCFMNILLWRFPLIMTSAMLSLHAIRCWRTLFTMFWLDSVTVYININNACIRLTRVSGSSSVFSAFRRTCLAYLKLISTPNAWKWRD